MRYVRGDIVHAADRDNQRFMERIEAAIGGALGATLVEKAETIAKHVRDLEDKNDRMMAHMDRVADMLDGPDDDMLPTERILEEGAKRALHRITELETEIAELEARVAKVELQRDAAAESRRAIIEGWHADLLRITQACGLVYEVQGDARPIGMVEDIVSAIEQVKQQSRIDEQIESFRSLLRQAVEERQEMVTLLTRATGWDQVGGDGSPVDEQGECDEEA